MASSRSNISYHNRSSYFPSTSDPTKLTVEAQLTKIQTSSTPSAEEICNNLSSLEDLYKSIDALLNLQETQQVLSHNRSERRSTDELLDGSVRILDICDSIKESVSQIKENIIDLQSTLRRRKGDSSMESSIAKYTSFHKKTKKEAKRLISNLKQMESKTSGSVLLVLKEVSAIAMTIFQSILLFVSVPILKQKQSKWSFFSLAQVECESHIEGFESRIEGIEKGLEGVFRGMVKTRASLLNSISSY